MELIGSVSCSTLAFVMPPLIELGASKKDLPIPSIILNVLYMLAGVYLALTGVADAAANMLSATGHHTAPAPSGTHA